MTGNKIRPLHDRVKAPPEEEVTKGGIIIPDSAKRSRSRAKWSPSVRQTLDNGKTVAPDVAVGNKVLFGKYAGSEVKLDGVEHLILREDGSSPCWSNSSISASSLLVWFRRNAKWLPKRSCLMRAPAPAYDRRERWPTR